jgi:AcrR family transcriptional regulator
MVTASLSKKPLQPPRKASRQHRRQQIIDATIKTLARRGYSQTTLTEVALTAGVSHGLLNFHFETKEKLLTETLLLMADEYRENWTTALAAAAPAPEDQLNCLLLADFNERVSAPDKLAAWCAFWGEAQSRPIYQKMCGANDMEYIHALEKICARLNSSGGYPHDPVLVARVIRVTIEGVWLDLITVSTPYTSDEALRTVFACIAAFFPQHFDASGLRR